MKINQNISNIVVLRILLKFNLIKRKIIFIHSYREYERTGNVLCKIKIKPMNKRFNPSHKRIFGHPKGLGVLFFVEFWERFSYYGMRALLIFYMYFAIKDGGLGMDKSTAQSIMAVYGALIYMTSVLGGWISIELQDTRSNVLRWCSNHYWTYLLKFTFRYHRIIYFYVLYYCRFWFNEAKHFKYCW